MYCEVFLCILSQSIALWFFIWVNTYSSYIEPIKVLYKRCIKLLSCAHPFARAPPLASRLGLLIFDSLFPLYCAGFIFKLRNNLLPFGIFVCFGGKTR